jgi:hypothetical protein
MTAVPPVPEVIVMIPLPLVGDEVTEYVAWNAAPETGPLAAPMSSVPVMLPVGVAPSAENSPENTTTPNAAGLVEKPAYVPFSALLLKEPATWGSPNPNKTFKSETNRKT